MMDKLNVQFWSDHYEYANMFPENYWDYGSFGDGSEAWVDEDMIYVECANGDMWQNGKKLVTGLPILYGHHERFYPSDSEEKIDSEVTTFSPNETLFPLIHSYLRVVDFYEGTWSFESASVTVTYRDRHLLDYGSEVYMSDSDDMPTENELLDRVSQSNLDHIYLLAHRHPTYPNLRLEQPTQNHRKITADSFKNYQTRHMLLRELSKLDQHNPKWTLEEHHQFLRHATLIAPFLLKNLMPYPDCVEISQEWNHAC